FYLFLAVNFSYIFILNDKDCFQRIAIHSDRYGPPRRNKREMEMSRDSYAKETLSKNTEHLSGAVHHDRTSATDSSIGSRGHTENLCNLGYTLLSADLCFRL